MDKAYDPNQHEDAIYKRWEASGLFNPDNLEGKPFSLMMPPPNVTGVLHLGHALENTLMDVMIRYQRMQGKKTLLLPGTDHAAVATQARVEDMLVKKGIAHPREHFGREGLLAEIKNYAEESKQTILKQIKRMGTSADWSRLAYTFDEDRNKAVNEVFVRMYNDGLIYRGHRVVNWSVKGQSTCSDDELVYVERPGTLYYFKYAKDFPIPIATTRPETKLGDTAVAVHPKGKWKKYIGKEFDIKNFGQSGHALHIKVIGDENIDQELGTGALGVTTAHSPVDFDMYLKQKSLGNDIGMRQVIGQDGNMTAEAGSEYQGLSVLEAREKVVAWLRAEGLLEKEEETIQNVGTSDRFKDVVEPIPMTQWFVDVNKEIPGRGHASLRQGGAGKSLKDLMREAVAIGHNGDPKQKVRITPERFEKTYFQWIDHLRDWNVSRQIWWGHRIPVWYCVGDDACKIKCKDPIVSSEPIKKCPHCGSKNFRQDEDTLDTWFSSGLWTFSTLGWPGFAQSATPGKPGRENDLANFHPTTWMQMGYEILFFWMARMILMSTYALDQIPFRDVYIHGMLRDKDGKKFSKSAGNGLDPIEIIETYGADALRFSLIAGVTPGNDARFYEEKVEGAKHLVNKIWNVSRYILEKKQDTRLRSASNGQARNKKQESSHVAQAFSAQGGSALGGRPDTPRPTPDTLADHWILEQLNQTITDVTRLLDTYQFSQAAETLRAFTWDDVADWYVEITKIEPAFAKATAGKGEKSEMLLYILQTTLKLWHPFLPFVTEQIWSEMFGEKNLLMIQQWPAFVIPSDRRDPRDDKKSFELLRSIITAIRSLRAEKNIPPAAKLTAYIKPSDQDALLKQNEHLLLGLARLDRIEYTIDIPQTAVGFVESDVEVFLDLSGAVDMEKETARLEKEIAEVAPYVASLEKKLKNKEFVNNAPEAVVVKEREKLREAREKLEKLEEQLKNM